MTKKNQVHGQVVLQAMVAMAVVTHLVGFGRQQNKRSVRAVAEW